MAAHPVDQGAEYSRYLRAGWGVAVETFFVVPSLSFKPLYSFVVLSHDRRKIVHFNVTQHPADEWTAQQIIEAFTGDREVPRYFHRDRDSIYGRMFKKKLAAIGIKELIRARKSPRQNP